MKLELKMKFYCLQYMNQKLLNIVQQLQLMFYICGRDKIMKKDLSEKIQILSEYKILQ